ncbi:MAG: hypothetical protein QM493_06425 [Sulfurovum sp.]
MQKLLFILLLVVSTYLYAKVEIVRSYYESGELYSEIKYIDGKPDGIDTVFYKNGNIKTQTNFVDGELTKESKIFDENGNIEYKLNDEGGTFYPKGEDFGISFKNENNNIIISGVEFKDENKKNAHINLKQYGDSVEFDVKDGQIDGLLTLSDNISGTQKIEYKKGERDGISKYYRKGKFYKEVEYKNDKKEGVAKEYYDNGTLKSKVFYKNNTPHKEAISYRKDGSISSKILINDNNQTTKSIYNEDGDLVSTYNIDINNVHIPTYNNNFNKTDIETNQIYKLYYNDGALKESVNITTNKGEARGYYRDGKLRYIIPYIKQYASGEAQYFDKNETLIASIMFKKNSKNGITKVYYPDSNRTLKYRYNYQYNKLNGIKTKYLKDGTLDYNITYVGNYIAPTKDISYREDNVSRVSFYENNNTEYNISIQENGKSVIKAYFDNGDIEFEINYANGEKNGTTSIYYGERELADVIGFNTFYIGKELKATPHTLRKNLEFLSNKLNGTTKTYNIHEDLIEETEYENGLKHGMSIEYRYGGRREIPYVYDKKNGKEIYYINGELQEETIYKDDKKNGLEIHYLNGIISSEATYKNNKKDGSYRMYYRDGKILMEEWYKDGKQDGYHRDMSQDGTVYSEILYKDGERVYEREVVE